MLNRIFYTQSKKKNWEIHALSVDPPDKVLAEEVLELSWSTNVDTKPFILDSDFFPNKWRIKLKSITPDPIAGIKWLHSLGRQLWMSQSNCENGSIVFQILPTSFYNFKMVFKLNYVSVFWQTYIFWYKHYLWVGQAQKDQENDIS